MRDRDMMTKGILAALLLFITPVLMAQNTTSGLTVQTTPPGAEVEVAGALTVRGITPITFPQGLEGEFDVHIKKAGYETYNSSLFLSTSKNTQLDVDLTAKTKFKAVFRSLFIPGWGQAYSDHKTKGIAFMMLAAGSAASYFIADNRFDDKRKTYDDYLARYNRVTDYAEKQSLYPLLKSARKDAYDAENVRRITIGATIAVWSLSFLDALLFFPEQKSSILVDQVSLEPDLQNGGGQITLSWDF